MGDMRFGRRGDAPAGRSPASPGTSAPADLRTEDRAAPEQAEQPTSIPEPRGPAEREAVSPAAQVSSERTAQSPATDVPLPPPRPRRSPLLGATPTSVPTDGQNAGSGAPPRRRPLLGATPTAVPTDPQPTRAAPPPERPPAAAQTAPSPAEVAEPETRVEDTVQEEQPAQDEARKRSFWTDRVPIPRQLQSRQAPSTPAEPETRVEDAVEDTVQEKQAAQDEASKRSFWTDRVPIPLQRQSRQAPSTPAEPEVDRPPREPRSLRPSEAETEGAPARARGTEEPKQGHVARARAVSLNWRSIGAVLVAVAIAFWLGRGLFGTGAPTASNPSDQSSSKVAVPKEKTHTKKVVIDGSTIRAAGALITLNPALAQPGASVNVSGSGFDPRSTVDVLLSSAGSSTGSSLGSARTDRTGNLNAQVTIPEDVRGGKVIITAKQQNSDNIATAEAVTAAGMGFAKLNKTSGKPGDTLAVNARGFAPGEKINVYWGRASGKPTSTLQASDAGTVSQGSIRVGVGQVGDATLVLVGAKSGTTATVPFYMLGLYPTAAAAPYALKAAEQLSVSASGFAPEERVLIYVNTSSGKPALAARADAQGNIGGLGFKVPFGLKGSQTLVMVGEESRASVSSGFQVLPYTPSVQTSTYGGSPGTSLSFFAKGFAPNEVVMVYLGRTKWSRGELVSAFRVNDRGEAGAAGNFKITGSDQGTLNFTLVGRQSGGQAAASLKVTPANGPVDLPPRQKYTLPRSLR